MTLTDDLREQSRGAVGFVFGALQAEAVPGPVLVEVMAALGFAESATRQLFARMLRRGHLERRRVGRVSVYRLAGGYLERWSRLRYGDTPPAWTGSFHVVVHDIPERQRMRRERLLGAAARAGYGQARPGLLIGVVEPAFVATWRAHEGVFTSDGHSADGNAADSDAAGNDAASDGVSKVTARGSAGMVEIGRLSLDTDAALRLAATAWSLHDRAADLRRARADLARLLDRLPRRPWPAEGAEPPRGKLGETEGMAATRLMFEAGMISGSPRFSAPALPTELLPPGWPAQDVQDLLHAVIERLTPAVGDYLYHRLAASPHAGLVEGGWWPPIATTAG